MGKIWPHPVGQNWRSRPLSSPLGLESSHTTFKEKGGILGNKHPAGGRPTSSHTTFKEKGTILGGKIPPEADPQARTRLFYNIRSFVGEKFPPPA